MPVATIGTPVARKDGVDKVTGHAKYALDQKSGRGMAHAVLVTSIVPKGRIRSIDASAALEMPGVLLVLTHANMDRLTPIKPFSAGGQAQTGFMPMRSDEVRYHGQIVAETADAAGDASGKVEVDIAPAPVVVGFRAPGASSKPARGYEAPVKGDADAAFAAAPVKLDAAYTTAVNHHNPIERYATIAAWRGDELTLYEPSQWVSGLRSGISAQLGIPTEKVHVVSPYVGGGFGGKATVMPHTVLVAVAARRLGRPVGLAVRRSQMFTVASFRPASRQRVGLAADRQGKFAALLYDAEGQTSRSDDMLLPGSEIVTRVYGWPTMRTSERLVETDTNTPGCMRSPMEVPSMFALESAIDELAVELGIDPVELGLRNDTRVDPVKGVPFSSRSLDGCLTRGAELFGWAKRDPRPGSMRHEDGSLMGWGVPGRTAATFGRARSPAPICPRTTADGGGTGVGPVGPVRPTRPGMGRTGP